MEGRHTQKRHHGFELVVDGSRRLFLLIAEKAREFQSVMALDLVHVELAAGLGKVVQRGSVRSQGLRLFREFCLFQELSHSRTKVAVLELDPK